jgi:hypothetical protein
MHRGLNLSLRELPAPNFYLVNVSLELTVNLFSATNGENSARIDSARHVALPNQHPVNKQL